MYKIKIKNKKKNYYTNSLEVVEFLKFTGELEDSKQVKSAGGKGETKIYGFRRKSKEKLYHSADTSSQVGIENSTYGHQHITDVKSKFGIEQEFAFQSMRSKTDFITLLLMSELTRNSVLDFKNDSSIEGSRGESVYGVEVVTSPLNFETARKVAASIAKAAQLSKGRAWDNNCGLHVHISKNLLTDKQVTKAALALKIMHVEGTLKDIIGRDPTRWASPSAINADKIIDYIQGVEDANKPIMSQRYSAINQTRATFEFRVFRGTTKQETVCHYIDFVKAIITEAKKRGTPATMAKTLKEYKYFNKEG